MSHTYLPNGYKFAMIALGNPGFEGGRGQAVEIPPRFVVSSHLPFEIPKSWKNSLGEIALSRVQSSRLFLTALQASRDPLVLDEESEDLKDAAYRLYFSILVSVGAISHQEAFWCTGGVHSKGADIRQSGSYPLVFRTAGAPLGLLNNSRIRRAARLAEALSEVRGTTEFSRSWRVTHAFYLGLRERQPGERLHQFVRCVEGFIKPAKGQTRDQFKHRSRLFLGDGNGELAGILFDIRSAVEHLHGPMAAVPFKTEKKQTEYLLRYAWVSEGLARYCLVRLLESKELWPFFRSDDKLERFWDDLSDDERRDLWGSPLDVRGLSAAFEIKDFEKRWEEQHPN